MYAYVEQFFRPALRIGFASRSSADFWAFHVLRSLSV